MREHETAYKDNFDALSILRAKRDEASPLTLDERAKLLRYEGWTHHSVANYIRDYGGRIRANSGLLNFFETKELDELVVGRQAAPPFFRTDHEPNTQVLWDLAKYALGDLTNLRVLDPNAGHGAVLRFAPPSVRAYGFPASPLEGQLAALVAPENVQFASQPAWKNPPLERAFDLIVGIGPSDRSWYVPSSDPRQRAQAWYINTVLDSLRDGGVAVILVEDYRVSDLLNRLRSKANVALCCEIPYDIIFEASGWHIIVLQRTNKPEMCCTPTEHDGSSSWSWADPLAHLAKFLAPGAWKRPAHRLLQQRAVPRAKPVNPECALALDLYKAVRQALDGQMVGQVGVDKLLERARDRYAKVRKLVGPIRHAVLGNGKLVSLARTREMRLLSLLEDENGTATTFLAAPQVRSNRGLHPEPTTEIAIHECLDNFGVIRLEWIAQRLQITSEELAEQAAELIFCDPSSDPEQWVPTDEYLSGDIEAKLVLARSAAVLEPKFNVNVEALERTMPPPMNSEDLRVPLGARWLPPDVVKDFILYLLGGSDGYYGKSSISVDRVDSCSLWCVSLSRGTSLQRGVQNMTTYGVPGMEAIQIIECAMNLQKPIVRRHLPDPNKIGKYKSVVDFEATAAAEAKLEEIRDEWDRWLRSDEQRMKLLLGEFSKRFRVNVRRKWSGDVLSFPGLAFRDRFGRPFDLHQHQKKAAERITFRSWPDDTFELVHPVGYGKTAGALAGFMRRIQLGLTDRVFLVVPKAVFEQWRLTILELYPSMAEELLAAPETFNGVHRHEFLKSVMAGEGAIVLLTYEDMMSIPVREDTAKALFERALEKFENDTSGQYSRDVNKLVAQRHKAALSAVKDQCEKHTARINKLRTSQGFVIHWEDIVGDPARTIIAFDEWQYLKRLKVTTAMERISGLPSGESARAMDGWLKTAYVTDAGGKAGGMTGTPVSNTLAEVHNNMRFFQANRLRMSDIQEFDSWAATFTMPQTGIEMDAVGAFRPVARLRFTNLDELIGLLAECWDFVEEAPEIERPDILGGEPQVVEVPGSDDLITYVEELAERADAVRARAVDPSEDNMLKITSDGRRAAMWNGDPAGGFPKSSADRYTKIDACAEKVWQLYSEHHEDKAVQLVFLDIGTPKSVGEGATTYEREVAEGLYGALRTRLVDRGMLGRQIAFIHDASTDDDRGELFKRINSGKVRVILGSTDKMGVGVNIQERAVAVHHLDCPWRPDGLIQRTGRVDRNGNKWDSIYVFYYVTSRSYDTCLWQLIQVKADFISKLQKGRPNTREADDVGDLVLTAAMAKAIALGDDRVLAKIKLENGLTQLQRQYRSWLESRKDMERDIAALPALIEKHERELRGLTTVDPTFLAKPEKFSASLRQLRSTDYEPIATREEADVRIHTIVNLLRPMLRKPIKVGTYRGCVLFAEIRMGALSVYLDVNGAELVVHNVQGTGTFTNLDREIAAISIKKTAAERTVTGAKNRYEALKEEMKKPWRHKHEADKLLAEYRTLCEELEQNGLVDAKAFNFGL